MSLEVRARCTAAAIKRAATGTLQACLEFHIKTKGPHEGQMVLWWGSFAGRAFPLTGEQLQLCGWDGDVKNMSSCTKNEIRLSVELVERSNGRTMLKGLWINPLVRELPGEDVSADELASLQSQLSEALHIPAREREPGEDDEPYDTER